MTKPDLETIIANYFIEANKRQAELDQAYAAAREKERAEDKQRQAKWEAEDKQRQAKWEAEAQKRQAEHERRLAAWDARWEKEHAENKARMQELEESRRYVEQHLGGIGKSNGDMAEDFFHLGTEKEPTARQPGV